MKTNKQLIKAKELQKLRAQLKRYEKIIAKDTHERQVLRESEKRYRDLFENVGDIIQSVAPDGSFLYVNRAWRQTLGYSKDEISKLNVFDIIHPDSRKYCEGIFKRVISGEEVRNIEVKFVTKKNKTVIVEGNANCRFDGGKPVSTRAIFRDITGQKKVEEMLKESEEKFRSITAAAKDAIIIMDDKGNIAYWNEAAEKVFGYSAQEATGKELHTFLAPHQHHDTYRKGIRTFTTIGRGPIIGKTLDLEAVKKDGTRFPIELSVSAMKIKNKWHAIGIIRDITKRKHMQEELQRTYNELEMRVQERTAELEKANKELLIEVSERKRAEDTLHQTEEQFLQAQKMEAIGRLAGGVAHDFNNILTTIIGNSTFLLRDLDSGDSRRADAEEIKEAADRAASLTRQLLAFSRKQVFQPRILDLDSVVSNMDKLLRRLLGEDIELLTVPGAGSKRVKADPGHIEQVVMNLAVNARDAMPKGGKLTIEIAPVELDKTYAAGHIDVKPGPYVMLSVSDTGSGMDKETQSRIFEPFFTTKEKDKGTGLGLSTVYGIIKQSGGNIYVYSEPEHGTTFRIYLPRVEGDASPDGTDEVPAKSIRGSETVLLVEDEEKVRKMACRTLKEAGYSVLEAGSGDEALRISKEHKDPIHLMVTDVVMPRMRGTELAKRLTPLRPDMKVLYVSGYTENTGTHHGILDSNVNFLGKPFTPDDLAHKVREVLSPDKKAG